MEIVFLALIALAVPVLGLVAFFRTLSLSDRLRRAEQQIASLELLVGRELAARAAESAQTIGDRPTGAEEAPAAPAAGEAGPPSQPAAGAIEPEAEIPLPEEPPLLPPSVAPASPGTPAQPPRTLEEVVGTRWAVWVGGIALGLGGIFLVRYSIEQGWFGPGARVAMGALFALALVAAGEILRRRDRAAGAPVFAGPAAAHVPSVLTSAGTLAAFATIYSAQALYGMIGPATAFVLLGLAGLASLLAAALHGPALAGVGLLASFAAPLLVSSEAPDAWAPVLYIAIVSGAGYALARLRRWKWLAGATAAGASAWAALLLGEPARFDTPLMVHLAIQAALAAAFLAVMPYQDRREDGPTPDPLPLAALAALTLMSGLALARVHDIGTERPLFAAALVAILLAAAWAATPAAGSAVIAALLATWALWTWPVAIEAARESSAMMPGPLAMPPMPDALWLFLVTATALGGALAASGWVRLMRGERLALLPAALHAAAAVAGPLLILFVAWLRVTAFDRSIPFALAALALGATFAGLARLFARQEGEAPARLAGLEAFAAGALAALGLGLAIIFEKNALTIALALAALGAAWVTTRTGLGLLRIGVAVLAVVTAARIVLDPAAGIEGVGATPIFNALLWTYGVPALAFWVAGRLLERQGEGRVVGLCQALSVSLAGLLVAFELRHWFSGGDMFAARPGHLEVGLDVFVALLAASVLVGLGPGRTSLVLRVASYAYAGLGAGGALFALFVINNPLLQGADETVLGGPVFNSLLAAYALPAAAAALLARRATTTRPAWFVISAEVLSFLLALAWLGMEIRRLFQGAVIDLDLPTTQAELYTYTAALLAAGLAALAFGILRGSRTARLASAILIVLAIAKAFLVDMAGLEGALRALSFIGLGVVLVGIGLVYQRFLFGRQPQPGSPDPAGAAPPS